MLVDEICTKVRIYPPKVITFFAKCRESPVRAFRKKTPISVRRCGGGGLRGERKKNTVLWLFLRMDSLRTCLDPLIQTTSKDMSWSLIREGTWGTICQDEDGEWENNKKEKSHSEKQTTINKAHAQQLKDHAWMQINRVEWNNYSCSWVVHWHCGAPAPLLGPFIAGRMGRRSDRVKKIMMPSIRLAFWLLLLFSWVVPKMYCCYCYLLSAISRQ